MTFFKNKLAVTIIVLSVSFLIVIGISVKRDNMSLPENGVGVTLNTFQEFVYGAASNVRDFTGFVFNFSKIKNENDLLKKKNDELENKALDYDSLEKENQRLREMLNFKEEHSDYAYIGCNIIGNAGGNFLNQFAINKGSKDGIKKQMVVVTAKGLVGQVTSVGSNWSIVQALSNENIAVSGMVANTDNNGMVKGYKDSDNRQLAKLYYLPEDSAIKNGDIIITSGLGGIYPKGIKIGTVISIEEDPGKVMKNAILEPCVDFNKLKEVFVVIPKEIRDIKY